MASVVELCDNDDVCFSPSFIAINACILRLFVRWCVRHSIRQSSVELNNLTNGSEEGGSSPFGPLTQRLVAALIEENIMTPLDDSSELEKGNYLLGSGVNYGLITQYICKIVLSSVYRLTI